MDRHRIDSHKLHLHPERVAQWLAAGDDWDKAKKIYPIYVEISPNGACNHRCTFCAVDYIGYKPRHLDPHTLQATLDDMAAHGVKSVMYAGEGEPLLAPDIATVINHTKKVGIDVAITTNATRLTPLLAEECLGSVTWLKASVNAGDAATYARVHRTKPIQFEQALSNLGAAVRLREAHGWEVTLGAQIVLLPENAHSAVTLASRCRDLGLDYLVVKPYSQHLMSAATAARGYDQIVYSQYQWLADNLDLMTTNKFKVVMRQDTMAHLEEEERYYKRCQATPHFWAYVMATGDVYGCSAYLEDKRFCYGNINERSFSHIWEGEERRRSFEYVNKELDINECRKNCRMENVNRYLWDLTHPDGHRNFI